MVYRNHEITGCDCGGCNIHSPNCSLPPEVNRIDDLIAGRIEDIETVYGIKIEEKKCHCQANIGEEKFGVNECDCGKSSLHEHCLTCGGII